MTFALALLAFGCGGHPTDEVLLATFSTHRAELEKLVEMFRADRGLGRVGSDFTRPDDPSRVSVTPERIAEYRRLCATVGAADCIEGYDAEYYALYGVNHSGMVKDPIWIHVSGLGLSISGSSKGYYYSASPQSNVVSSLEGLRLTRSNTWLRHIEGPWYLYFDYED
jgi:hypothetical protein